MLGTWHLQAITGRCYDWEVDSGNTYVFGGTAGGECVAWSPIHAHRFW
jgi:hypothetical protein